MAEIPGVSSRQTYQAAVLMMRALYEFQGHAAMVLNSLAEIETHGRSRAARSLAPHKVADIKYVLASELLLPRNSLLDMIFEHALDCEQAWKAED